MDKYLFLDVDGVLNTTRSQSLYGLSKPCMRRLQLIVNDTGCKLVLSSTWRLHMDTYMRLQRALGYRGMALYGRTPHLREEKGKNNRGDEIALWLSGFADQPYVYAIVDDDSDMNDNQLPHFFQTDPDYGLTDTIAYRITYHLNN